MSPTGLSTEALAAYADASAEVLGLPIAPEHRPGVLQYLALAARLAEAVHAVDVSAHDESAMVFRPVSPEHPAPEAVAAPLWHQSGADT
jgi:hypothetical protein